MFKKTPEATKLSEAIEEALTQLNPHDDDYTDQVEAIERLYKLKTIDQSWTSKIDPNAIAATLGSLGAVLLIINHEQANVITSKAFGLVKFR